MKAFVKIATAFVLLLTLSMPTAAASSQKVDDQGESIIGWEGLLGKRLADFDSKAYKEKNVSYQGGYSGQCTWYCVGRAYEVTGKLITVAPNAKKWLNIKLPEGASIEKDNKKVKANTIAVVTNTHYGHVMFVEAVEEGWVYYTEANVPVDSKIDPKDGILKRQKIDDFTKRIGGYIDLEKD